MPVYGPPDPEASPSLTRRLGTGRTVATAIAVLLGVILALPALVPSGGSANRSVEPAYAALQGDDGTPLSLELSDATPAGASTPVGTPAGTPVSRPTRPPEVPIAERPLNVACYIPARQAVSFADGRQTGDQQAATPAADDGISALDEVDLDATPQALPDGLTWAGVPAGAADELTARDIERLVRILGTCLSEADYETITYITTDEFRGLLIGTDDPVPAESFISYAEQFPIAVLSIVSVEDVEILDNGDATATVRYQVGHQLLQGEWTFTLFVPDAEFRPETAIAPAAARWIIAAQEPQPVEAPEDAVEVSVEVTEYEMDLSEDEVEGDTLVLNIENSGEQDHEVVVLRLEDGATTADILVNPGPDLPEGITVIGQQTVLAGEEATMVLTGLEPGDYALVDLLPDVSGVPFLALGVEAALTIEAP